MSLAAVALAGLGASPARADTTGGATSGGAFAQAKITVTVNGGNGHSYHRSFSVPATCWWEPFELGNGYGAPPVNPDDPASVEAYFEYIAPFLSGHAAGARLELPDANYVKDIIRRVAAGEKLTFYEARCVAGKNPVDEGLIDKAGTWQGIDFGVRFRAFPPGNPPGPVVPAEALADLARQELTFADPEIDYNPKLADGGASLVGVDTWFWVANPGAALAPGGTATATATAGGGGDPFSQATVTANNSGLTIRSDGLQGGVKECPYPQYTRGYGSGATDANACKAVFTRASVGHAAGWPVRAETIWNVSWSGVEANGTAVGPNAIALINPPVGNMNLPVAESQAVVNG